MDAKSLGPVIRKWRIESGFTQQELGRRAGVSKKTVGAIERGERSPERSELVKLSRALGKDPADLLTSWYRNELNELNKMLDARPPQSEEKSAETALDSGSRVDQIIDQIAALAKDLYRESRNDFREIFLDWLSPSALPPSSPSRPARRRVSRKRGSTKV